jgi:hypothetical protein
MRIALERFTEPVLGWIPDITAVPRTRQIVVGVVASLLVHLLIFGGAVVSKWIIPEKYERPPTAPEPNLEVTVMPKPQPEVVPLEPVKPDRKFLTNEGLKEGEKPKEAQFEAEKDMTAGTEVPKTGDSELPGQEGEKAPAMRDFENQEISLNKTSLALRQQTMKPAPIDQRPQPEKPPQETQEQPATVAPMYAPLPLDDKKRAAAEKAKPQDKLPEPAKATRATPSPLEKVKEVSETQIALLQTQPEAKAMPEEAKPEPKKYTLPTPAPMSAASPAAAFQQLRKTRNESVISNRGIPGVNAINTPAGRWTMGMKRAFSQNWQLFIKQNPEMISISTVRVKFAVLRTGGKPVVTKVEGDSGASTSAVEASRRAVADTPLQPPPADLFDDPASDRLEDEVTFILY